MNAAPLPEVWLRGPVAGVPPTLQPAVHALMQAAEDIEAAAASLSTENMWHTPGGAASVGFHLKHIGGSIDRLLTYARGERLDDRQRRALAAEREADPTADAASLVREAQAAINRGIEQIRATPPETLGEPRTVGRGNLPSTVLGLIFHAAEHAQRHTGQVIATAKIVSRR